MPDALHLCPATPDEIADALSFALQYQRRKRVHHAGGMTRRASIRDQLRQIGLPECDAIQETRRADGLVQRRPRYPASNDQIPFVVSGTTLSPQGDQTDDAVIRAQALSFQLREGAGTQEVWRRRLHMLHVLNFRQAPTVT
jgi:hypothetical protein